MQDRFIRDVMLPVGRDYPVSANIYRRDFTPEEGESSFTWVKIDGEGVTLALAKLFSREVLSMEVGNDRQVILSGDKGHCFIDAKGNVFVPVNPPKSKKIGTIDLANEQVTIGQTFARKWRRVTVPMVAVGLLTTIPSETIEETVDIGNIQAVYVSQQRL